METKDLIQRRCSRKGCGATFWTTNPKGRVCERCARQTAEKRAAAKAKKARAAGQLYLFGAAGRDD